jgi:hypothetical protein
MRDALKYKNIKVTQKHSVIPAYAGIHAHQCETEWRLTWHISIPKCSWIPAFAGMTLPVEYSDHINLMSSRSKGL